MSRRHIGCVALCAAMVGCGSDSPTAPTPSPAPAPAATAVSSLGVSASSTTLEVGTTTTVTATATYSNGSTNTVTPTWSSSDTGVATVSSSGTVTAVAAGSATITGTYEGQSGSVALTVSEEEDATVTETFEFDPVPPNDITEGDTGYFRVNITRNGTRERIVDGVTSSATTVLTLALEGDRWRYTGTGPGTAEIRVVHGDSRRLTHAVQVEEPPTPWSRTGTGATILDLPTRITRIRIEGEYNGSSENFVVWCGGPEDRGGLLVNELLGTSWSNTSYSGIHTGRRSYGGSGQPCRELQVVYSSGVQWSITETAPRSGFSPAATTGSLADDVDAVQRLRRQATTARRQR